MKNYFLLFGFSFVLISAACKTVNKQNTSKTSTETRVEVSEESGTIKLLFGSCNKQDKPQPLWNDLIQEKGDMFLWLGDNIYGDSEQREVLQGKYDLLNENAGYSKFKKSIKIDGTWDDHDYGINDGGKEFPAKALSQQLLLDFLEVPQDNIRRKREGVYDKLSLNKYGINVDIFILDTRYFRDPIIGIKGKFKGESVGTILGKAQWKWLEEELEKSTADIHVFVSSIQLIPEEHGFEKWGNFPEQKNKFLNLISSYNINYPIILSGDRHSAEISEQQHMGYSFYDITASSLNSGRRAQKEENKFRIPESAIVFDPNYGVLEISKDDQFKIKASIKTSYNSPVIEEVLFGNLKR